MKSHRVALAFAVLAMVVVTSSSAPAAVLLSPGDPIIAIDTDPPGSASNYPGAESPAGILDGDSGTKYLNFAEENSGFIVTPSYGMSTVRSFVITTANDAAPRDPTSWELYGTNEAILSTDNSNGTAESWTLLDSGTVSLPEDRQTVGPPVTVSNDTSYASYRMLFPTVVDAVDANSMQIADVGLFESTDGSGTNILASGDPILAIDADLVPDSDYPGNEPPSNTIDGTLDKYLNFGEVNSGFIVTPTVGPASIVTAFQITTANDSEERDPANWELYGTNDLIASTDNSRGDGEDWTLIDSGIVELPVDRDTVGPVVAVDNSTAYTSYRMIFTGLRDDELANSMQIAEIQFDGEVIPEPSSVVLVAVGLLCVGLFGWRRRRAS